MVAYVDVHAHLTHEKFAQDLDAVIQRSQECGLGAVIVNGLEPKSNRQILELAQKHPVLIPALGIYPIDAVNEQASYLPFPVESFSVVDEIAFIRQQAVAGNICAVGECGLDGHWLGQNTFQGQEKVFLSLLEIAMEAKIPAIIHTRKLEQRTIEILEHVNIKQVNFHCFGGKVKLAQRASMHDGWYFSIPANARHSQSFTKMLQTLPAEKILTETDCPFLAPQKGNRSEPRDVISTVAYLAELRGWSETEAKEQVWSNFKTLFQGVPQIDRLGSSSFVN
jgi:TatD DNase family protein